MSLNNGTVAKYQRGRFDIEGDGLLDTFTDVHCIAVKLDDEPTRLFVGEKAILEALELLDQCRTIVAHYGIGFDLIALYKRYKWKPKAIVEDTLTLDCLLHPDREGGHSLENLGLATGVHKTDYKAAYIEWRLESEPDYVYISGDEWKEYNPVMGAYCVQDVDALAAIDDMLLRDREGWDWSMAVALEHAFAKDFAVQGLRGVMVDRPLAGSLVARIDAEMADIEAKVEPLLPKRPGTKGQLKEVTPPKRCFKKDGQPCSDTLKWFDQVKQDKTSSTTLGRDFWYGFKFGQWHKLPTPMLPDGSAREPLITEFPTTMADQQVIKTWLMDMGWRPTMWNFKKAPDEKGKLRYVRGDDGQLVPTWPKFHDKGVLCPNLEHINTEFEHVALVVRWVVIRHRRGFIQSIIDNIRSDGTVSATGMALGTPTSRVTHQVVANTPKAEDGVVLGRECRSIFTARKGATLGGVDAAGLELRMLAHYVESPELIEMVCNGNSNDKTDIHSVLAQACHPLVPSRTIQKNVTYGWLYGASDKKLGQTAGHPDGKAEKVGKEIRRRMVAAIPGLDVLMKKIEGAARLGYIKAIDGRRIDIRAKHATLNTLLQSAGSILVKMATVYMNAGIRRKKLRAWMVVHYHDEVILDAHPDDVEKAGKLFIEGLIWAGKKVGCVCPLDGNLKVGHSWADIH